MATERVMLRREAQAHALTTRLRFGQPLDRPVDVYSVIRRERLWLLFEPLGAAFGMFQRQGDAAGVVINVKVHPALQRYTAAHELGHYVLGHSGSLDPESHITEWLSLAPAELSAQFFAAEFLMPDAAVNSMAAALGIERRHVDAISAYQLSLRLRTSYSATIVRLVDLEWIDAFEARRLRKIAPKDIKELLLGRPLDDPRADVWVVRDSERFTTETLTPHVGDEFVVALTEDPTTGYRWNADVPQPLGIDRDEFRPMPVSDEIVVGGHGMRRIELALREPRAAHAKFVLQRAWERSAVPPAEVDVTIDATERPIAGVDFVQQQALLASSSRG